MAVFLETARRFFNGQSATTPIESDIYAILRDLSPELKDVCRCAINVADAVPSTQRDRIISPEVKATTALTVDNVANLLAREVLRIASLNVLENETGLTNPRPGRVRPTPGGTPEFPSLIDPVITRINNIRTGFAIGFGVPTPEEVERTCTLNAQNQLICTVQTKNCPGNTRSADPVCFVFQKVMPGDLVNLKGFNFFTTEAKVIIASKLQPSLRRVVSAIVFGDVDTPVFDEQGKVIADDRVNDRLLFTVPEDLPDGIYSIQVQVENTNPQVARVGTFTSDPEFLRILPPPTTNFQVLAQRLICVSETSGPGSDEVALTFLTSLLVSTPLTGKIDLSSLTTQEFQFDDVDSGETRPINFAPVQANQLLGANISIVGFEVDDEDFYRQQIRDFGAAYKAALDSIWTKTASTVASSVAGAIAAVAGATFAVGSIIVAAVAVVVTATVAFFYALWAPADPIIQDSIGLTLLDLATLTDGISPPPPRTEYNTAEDIKVIAEPLTKGLEYEELRGYISEDEESLYQLVFRYSRF